MRRIAAILVLVLAAGGVAVLGSGAGNGGSYKVRAIFDDAVYVIPGEDVKISGVKVGKVDSLDVTPEKKAAIVLAIDQPGFQDFRSDAHCIVRPQSLIGEQFVECEPTQPRAVGAPVAPRLRKVAKGPGQGQYLLPVENTSTPVSLDLINNILRRPYSERLSILLSELGTGLAGRGQDLRDVIRRSNPALAETDKVLKILADQNQTLADLARDSDTVLGPLARERGHVADSIVQANTVAQATAERRADLERNIQRLPTFLRELRPTMVRLGAFSDQAAPVLDDLGAQAPAINRFIRQLGPFAQASIPAFQTLGDAADVGRPALIRARPVIRDLRSLAGQARPVARNLAKLTTSLRDTGGVERLMDYLFFQVAAINGFDRVGHYLRAALIVNTCSSYTTAPVAGCSANFIKGGAASAASTQSADPQLARTAAILRGQDPAAAQAKTLAKPGGPSVTSAPKPAGGGLRLPKIALPGRLGNVQSPAAKLPRGVRLPGSAPVRGANAPTDPRAGLFDYLFGADG